MALTAITRSEAAALIPEEVVRDIIQDVTTTSVVLSNPSVRRLTMTRKQTRLPILSFLPSVSWVDPTDTGTIAQTQQKWTNKYVNAEKLAAIVPIPKDVLNDQDYDLWAEIRPRILEGIASKIDAAILFGTDVLGTFPESIEEGCDRVDHDVKAGTGVDYAEDVNQAFAHVEADGMPINAAIAAVTVKQKLRGLRDDQNAPIFSTSLQNDGMVASVYGESLQFARNDAWPADTAEMFVGDWSQVFVGIRQDVEWELLREATVGGVNLAETDQVGLKATFRFGWQLGNPPTLLNDDDDDRYPFACVRPSGWVGSAGTIS